MKKQKQSKQSKKPKITTAYNPEVMSVIKIAIIVLVIFAVVYFFTAFATGKIKFGKDKTENEETTIQYEEILAGESFTQTGEDYLVLFYDSTSTEAGLYNALLTNYKTKANALKFYKVDMANPMNQMYQAEENSNLFVSKAADLKIKESTLIHFVNHQVSNVYEGNTKIQEYFTNFGK